MSRKQPIAPLPTRRGGAGRGDVAGTAMQCAAPPTATLYTENCTEKSRRPWLTSTGGATVLPGKTSQLSVYSYSYRSMVLRAADGTWFGNTSPQDTHCIYTAYLTGTGVCI
jgi:hypothetical protein